MSPNKQNKKNGLTHWAITNLLRGEIASSVARSPPDEVAVCISDEETYPAFLKALHTLLEQLHRRRADRALAELIPNEAVGLFADASQFGIVPQLLEEGHAELDFTPAQLAILLHCWNCAAPKQNKPKWGFNRSTEFSGAVRT